MCQKITATGQFARVKQCRAENITIGVEITPCGPQPKHNNMTIAATGWELTPFTLCYWRGNLININGIPHELRNNSWEKVASNITLDALHMIHSFLSEDDNSYTYISQTNPMYNNDEPAHVNIMADILAITNERNQRTEWSYNPDVSEVLVTGTEHSFLPDMAKWMQIFKILGLVAVVAGGLYMFLGCCGGAACILNIIPFIIVCCCWKNQKRPTDNPDRERRRTDDIELQQQEPMV